MQSLNVPLEELEKLQSVLSDAWSDIGHWCQLAEYQRAETIDPDHDPIAPTTDGIKKSRSVQKAIGQAQKAIRKLVGGQPCATHN